MKTLKRTLFSIALIAGMSGAAFAQKDGQKKPPPKGPPPVVTPQPKDPPQRPPSDGKKPKKPAVNLLFWKAGDE